MDFQEPQDGSSFGNNAQTGAPSRWSPGRQSHAAIFLAALTAKHKTKTTSGKLSEGLAAKALLRVNEKGRLPTATGRSQQAGRSIAQWAPAPTAGGAAKHVSVTPRPSGLLGVSSPKQTPSVR